MTEEFNLGTDFFRTALTQYLNKDVQVLSHRVEPACAKGENFASAVYRAIITFQSEDKAPEEVSLILKVNSNDDAVNEVLEEFQTFERELTTYKEILVECDQLLSRVNDKLDFSPQFIYADTTSLVLEDIKPKGYKTADHFKRLDLSHAEVFIKKLAKFHATTIAAYKKNPDLFRYCMNGGLTEKETPYHEYFRTATSEFLATVKKYDELQPYISYVESFTSDVVNKVKKVYSRKAGEFHVLNHGDCWMNNCLWKYDEAGNVTDVLVVDFQEGFFGSPGIDLNHFIFTSCQKPVVLNNIRELVQLYQKVLSETMVKLGVNQIPTVEQIQEEMRNKNEHALIVTACYLPVMLIQNKEHASASNFFLQTDEAQRIRRIVYENPQYVDILKQVLPIIKSNNNDDH